MADPSCHHPVGGQTNLQLTTTDFTPDYREATMPDSPDPKGPNSHSLSPVSSVAPLSNMSSRPLSTSSSMSGLNGMHSPHSSINGRTPSPPFLGATGSSQQLPPACGARQLSKLKRFLTTLMQFGSDISPEIGERVRSLVLGLVNSHLSIEEFHSKLQEATNFPLRPFVIPFLKANLPLLQRELLHCAQLAKQTPQQYLAHNEHILFDPARSPVEPQDLAPELNENGKRRSPDRPKENGIDPVHPAKRPHTLSPGGSTGSRVSPGSAPFPFQHTGQIRLEDISMTRELRERERIERERIERERLERERDRHFPGYSYQRTETFDNLDRIEDDWKHIENMLHSIVTMVDRCKRALAVLQERSIHDHEELAAWMRRHSDTLDTDMKKRTSDLMATTLRHTEDRVSEVKRRAEEAVNEVKRQAVAELQKAVAAAEAKATEMVSSERAKMERMLQDTRKQVQEEVIATINHQEESSETCWNCGRKASETCSGCNIARYCGSFCQHKDWENHHRVCGQAQHASGATTSTSSSSSSTNKSEPPLPTLNERDSATNAQGSVTAEASVTVSVTSSPVAPPAPPLPSAPSAPSPVNSVTSSKSESRSCSPTEAKVVEPTH